MDESKSGWERWAAARYRQQAGQNARRGPEYRDHKSYHRADGRCSCEICEMLNNDPSIVHNVFKMMIILGWHS